EAVGWRVVMGLRSGSSYRSDFWAAGSDRLVESAVALARITSEDPFAGLPQPEELGATDRDLRLYYDNVASLSAEQKIELAKRAERSALDFDPRISNSEGGAFGSSWSRRVLATAPGFQGEYRRSWCSLHVVPVAHAGEEMQRGYWDLISHHPPALAAPAARV